MLQATGMLSVQEPAIFQLKISLARISLMIRLGERMKLETDCVPRQQNREHSKSASLDRVHFSRKTASKFHKFSRGQK